MSDVTDIRDAENEKLERDAKRLRMFRGSLSVYFEEIAVIRKMAFDAHVKAGFTEAQALQLVRDIETE